MSTTVLYSDTIKASSSLADIRDDEARAALDRTGDVMTT